MSYDPTPFPTDMEDSMQVHFFSDGDDAEYYSYSDEPPGFEHNNEIEGERDFDPLTVSSDDIPDDAIAFSTSIDHSKQLIFKTFGIHTSKLRTHPIPGLVVMPLKDFGLIRKDHRHHRSFPHLLVLPVGDNFQMNHPDFAKAMEKLLH